MHNRRAGGAPPVASSHVTAQPAGATARWHLRDLLAVCGATAAAWGAAYLALRVLRGILGAPPTEPPPYVATDGVGQLQEIVLAMVICAAVVMTSRRRGIGPVKLGLRSSPRRWLAGAVLLAATVAALRLVAAALLLGSPDARAALRAMSPVDEAALSGWLVPGTLLSSGVVTAFREELVYRGVLFGWLSDHFGVVLAVLCSAAVFAAMHLPLGAVGAAVALVAGLMLGWLRAASGSLWPGILLHAAANISGLLLVAALD